MVLNTDSLASLIKENRPLLPVSLHNQYFALRHGESEANKHQIIVSDPKDGVEGYGLTIEGANHVRLSVQKNYDIELLNSTTLIYSSDFTRARDTAQIARLELKCGEINWTSKLRERFFGTWEKTHVSNYRHVWSDDEIDFCHNNGGVESRIEVLSRVLSLIFDLEEQYEGKKILLISHGDPIQILQTCFWGKPLAPIWQVSLLGVGEIEKLAIRESVFQ